MDGRREFIKKALYSILAFFGLGFLIPGIILFSPAGIPAAEVVYFPLIDEEEIPRSGVKKCELTYSARGRERKARIYLVSSPSGVTALSATCSHLGCLVNYQKDKNEFLCPCHGGRYDISGRNIAGPPPAPLSSLPTKIDRGMLHIGIKV